MLISLRFNPDEFLHFPAVRRGIFMLGLNHENSSVFVDESLCEASVRVCLVLTVHLNPKPN